MLVYINLFIKSGDVIVTINEKCQLLPIIKTQKVIFKFEKDEKGVLTYGYEYGKDIKEWENMLYDLDLVAYDYRKNMELLQNKEIAKYTRDEVLTHMTYIIRGERFCDGVIAANVEDGTLEKLCMRLHEITK